MVKNKTQNKPTSRKIIDKNTGNNTLSVSKNYIVIPFAVFILFVLNISVDWPITRFINVIIIVLSPALLVMLAIGLYKKYGKADS